VIVFHNVLCLFAVSLLKLISDADSVRQQRRPKAPPV